MNTAFYVGTYATSEREGILCFDADFLAGKIHKRWTYKGIVNPSYLLKSHKNKDILYSVEELAPEGRIRVLRITDSGLVQLCTLSSGGAHPCHLALDDHEEFLFVSNYTSGNLAVFRLNEQGVPVCRTDLVHHIGKGPNVFRQDCAHVHYACYHDDILYVNDLGVDKVFRYFLNRETGKLEQSYPPIKIPSGSGPRHLCFSKTTPNIFYLICELTSTVYVVRVSNRDTKILQSIRTLPSDFSGLSTAAAIKLSNDGKALFVSNRGHDSITVFSILKDGTLLLKQVCKTGGKAPRDVSFIGDYIVAANQESNCITVLFYDAKEIQLKQTGVFFEVECPVLVLST